MPVEGEDKILFRCQVLYIGSAVPMEASKGLEAIQQPLRERYPYKDEKKISGVDALLSVMPTGIQMVYSGDNESAMWFPISSLSFCAAVRCIHLLNSARQRVPRFVSLNSPAAGGMYSQKPAIFAAITRRMKGRKVLECHSFICSSTGDAIGLVQSSKMADRGFRNGIVPSGVSLARMNSVSLRPQSESELHFLTDQKFPQTDVAQEFYETPPSHGYFYGTGSTLVRSYTIEKINNDILLKGPNTLDRSGYRKLNSPVLVPPHSYYMPGPRRIGPAPVNLSQSSRRFLSPPPPHVIVRNDPNIFAQSTLPTYARLPYSISQSMYEKVGNRSPSLERSHRSTGSSTIRPEENSSQKSRKEAAIKNGRDTESSSGSSRPPSPPLDYEPFTSSLGVTKTHFSRKDRHEKDSFITGAVSSPSVIYPYDPYIYPAYYTTTDRAMRPRSLSPPAAESEYSTKNSRKKKDKSKKKSKKSAKNGSTEDILNDNTRYSSQMLNGSDNLNRSMLDRTHTFQNEKAFARSIAAEGKKHGIYNQENMSYRNYPDNDLVN